MKNKPTKFCFFEVRIHFHNIPDDGELNFQTPLSIRAGFVTTERPHFRVFAPVPPNLFRRSSQQVVDEWRQWMNAPNQRAGNRLHRTSMCGSASLYKLHGVPGAAQSADRVLPSSCTRNVNWWTPQAKEREDTLLVYNHL